MDIGWDDHAACRHFIPDELRRYALSLCDVVHFVSDAALARGMKLSRNGVLPILVIVFC